MNILLSVISNHSTLTGSLIGVIEFLPITLEVKYSNISSETQLKVFTLERLLFWQSFIFDKAVEMVSIVENHCHKEFCTKKLLQTNTY